MYFRVLAPISDGNGWGAGCLTLAVLLLSYCVSSSWCLGLVCDRGTVLPAKSGSGVKLCYKVIKDLESIDHLCINPIRMIGLIHK